MAITNQVTQFDEAGCPRKCNPIRSATEVDGPIGNPLPPSPTIQFELGR